MRSDVYCCWGFWTAPVQKSIKSYFHLASELLVLQHFCPPNKCGNHAGAYCTERFILLLFTSQCEFHSFLFGDDSGVRTLLITTVECNIHSIKKRQRSLGCKSRNRLFFISSRPSVLIFHLVLLTEDLFWHDFINL